MQNCSPSFALKPAAALLAAVALLTTGCALHRRHTETHAHGSQCGHIALQHDGHTDYLHDGHLHHTHGAHADEHRLPVTTGNPDQCTPAHACAAHARDHQHGSKCGHEAVPHGDHTDYLVSGHLHHAHAGHCDDHGAVTLATR